MLVKILFALLVLASMIYPVKYLLLIFQQNRYEIGRYKNWLKHHKDTFFKRNLSTVVLFVVMLIVSFIPNNLIYITWLLVLKFVWDFLVDAKQKYIKPLKVTNRVKRQIILIAFINIKWIFIYMLLIPEKYYAYMAIIGLVANYFEVVFAIWLLQPLEKYFHTRFKKQAKELLDSNPSLIKVGITGSYGKTSSKNILQEILSSKYYTLMTPESFNTPMGISITIKNHLKKIHQVFICEMGADHVGDIVELMEFVNPQYGIVTSIGPQHLNTFKTLDNIINEKMQMIEMLPENGFGIINIDNEYIENYKIKNTCKVVTVGINNENALYRAKDIVYSNAGSSFVVNINNKDISFSTRLLGQHNIMNILVAIALAVELGISDNEIVKAVARCPYVKHRLELKKINGLTFIDNAFNSNPSSANMSLEVLSKMNGKRIIVTPGMIDLGEKEDALNYQFGYNMKDKVDICILVGINQTRQIYKGLQDSGFNMENVIVKETVQQAFAYVYQNANAQDTILLENDLPDIFNV